MKSCTVAKLFALTALATVASPVGALAVTVNIVSDGTWTVSDTNMTPLGNAQNVCLNPTAPPNCPIGTTPPPTLYGYPLVGWTANLSGIPGAKWIWAPNITGATSPAANAEFIFQTEFYLCGPPKGGTIWVAADNSAEVFLNGASTPVLTSASHSALSTVSIPSASLVQGLNVIQVKAKNGSNPSDCGSNQYQCNPAGVVFGASFQDALAAPPTCTDSGRTFTAGQPETLSCPAGKTGSRSRYCICIGSNGIWGPISDACTSQCTGSNGRLFNVNEVELLACPPGQTGSESPHLPIQWQLGTHDQHMLRHLLHRRRHAPTTEEPLMLGSQNRLLVLPDKPAPSLVPANPMAAGDPRPAYVNYRQ